MSMLSSGAPPSLCLHVFPSWKLSEPCPFWFLWSLHYEGTISSPPPLLGGQGGNGAKKSNLPITPEIPSISEALCQEPETRLNVYFLLQHNSTDTKESSRAERDEWYNHAGAQG